MSDISSELKTDIELARRTLNSSKEEPDSLDDCLKSVIESNESSSEDEDELSEDDYDYTQEDFPDSLENKKMEPEFLLLEAVCSMSEIVHRHVFEEQKNSSGSLTYSDIFDNGDISLQFEMTKCREILEDSEFASKYNIGSRRISWHDAFHDCSIQIKKYLIAHEKINLDICHKYPELEEFVLRYRPSCLVNHVLSSSRLPDNYRRFFGKRFFINQDTLGYLIKNSKTLKLIIREKYIGTELTEKIFNDYCSLDTIKYLFKYGYRPSSSTVKEIFKTKCNTKIRKFLRRKKYYPSKEEIDDIFSNLYSIDIVKLFYEEGYRFPTEKCLTFPYNRVNLLTWKFLFSEGGYIPSQKTVDANFNEKFGRGLWQIFIDNGYKPSQELVNKIYKTCGCFERNLRNFLFYNNIFPDSDDLIQDLFIYTFSTKQIAHLFKNGFSPSQETTHHIFKSSSLNYDMVILLLEKLFYPDQKAIDYIVCKCDDDIVEFLYANSFFPSKGVIWNVKNKKLLERYSDAMNESRKSNTCTIM